MKISASPKKLSETAAAAALRARCQASRIHSRCPASERVYRGLLRMAQQWDAISRLWLTHS